MPRNAETPSELEPALEWWQIILLAISGIIGVTIFSTMGSVLHTASTAGTLVALGFVGTVAICVMASLGELILLWPVPGALVEYVRHFVDEDLAKVVGVSYWYTWSSIFTVLLIVAFDHFCELLPRVLHRSIVLVIIAIVLVFINALGVKTYGYIEAIGGIIKFLQAVIGGLFMWIAIGKIHGASNPGFSHVSTESNHWITALCMSIPVLTYGFIGVEIVAITAFEAKDRNSLRWPTRYIAWIMLGIYMWVSLPGTILVPWADDLLQPLGPAFNDTTDAGNHKRDSWGPEKHPPCNQSYPYYPFVELAAFKYGSVPLSQYFDACIIYFCVSSANTALYVASRTLYALFRPDTPMPPKPHRWYKQCIPSPHELGRLSTRKVPVAALIASAVSWVWLVALRVENVNVLEIMTKIGAVGGVMVWAAECFAFIKYYEWLGDYGDELPDYYDRFSRDRSWQQLRPFGSSLQPWLAWIGLAGCFLIILVFCSASWWDGDATAVKVTAAYSGPAAMLSLFGSLKLWRRFRGDTAGDRLTGLEISESLQRRSRLRLEEEPLMNTENGPLTLKKTIATWFRGRKHPTTEEVDGANMNGIELHRQQHASTQDSLRRQRTDDYVEEQRIQNQEESR